eukprot:1317752-Pyramimonas_sp.AAC.1
MGRGRVARRVGRWWVAGAVPARPRPQYYPQLRGAAYCRASLQGALQCLAGGPGKRVGREVHEKLEEGAP